MEKHGMGLEKLKERYETLKLNHNLPEFKSMNEEFQIEKISEIETEILIREVRKYVGDKLANYMRFIENLLNPVNASMFVFSMVKLMDAEDKKKLSDMYKELMKMDLNFIQLDLEFNEENEASFIRDSVGLWKNLKKDMSEIMKKINNKWDDKADAASKGYFG